MLLVDTSVWSLALRRRRPVASPHVDRFRQSLTDGDVILTGIVMQELLQGMNEGPTKDGVVAELGKLSLLVPERADHRTAAEVYTSCRSKGVQVGTVDALLAAPVRSPRPHPAQYRPGFRAPRPVHQTEAVEGGHSGSPGVSKAAPWRRAWHS